MSLYYEAAAFLKDVDGSNGIPTSRIYGAKDLKTKPAQIVAVISQTAKWSNTLSSIIEDVEVLRLERKLTPQLVVLLTHDLLLSKHGVAAPKDHVLRVAIERHKARLGAEFTKARIKAGYTTLDDWRNAVEAGLASSVALQNGSSSDIPRHPRWIRVNTLKTTVKDELSNTFSHLSRGSLLEITNPQAESSAASTLAVDRHIPNLVAIPEALDSSFTSSAAYRNGKLIFQDKASCFPAYLLNPCSSDGDIIDACAAPGNKTTHLGALLMEAQKAAGTCDSSPTPQRIFACERDKIRAGTLQKMVHIAGADKDGLVQCLAGQDFLRLDPQDKRWKRVGALLLDPSCSGSGIVGRDENDASDALPSVTLPRRPEVVEAEAKVGPGSNRGKKRKREAAAGVTKPTPAAKIAAPTATAADPRLASDSTTRLESLSNFQTKLLTHALSFPSARKVVYSTCSIHAEENEIVVLRALASSVAKSRGWRILSREEQVKGMKEWDVRGVVVDVDVDVETSEEQQDNGKTRAWSEKEARVVAEASIRCEKGTAAGTMGFFVAGFVRDAQDSESIKADVEDDEDDFEGFSDDNNGV